MKKAALLSGVLLVLLLVAASVAPVAFAQGTTGDKVVMGDSYTLQEGQTLNGNLLVMGGNAAVNNGATVQGDVTVLGGTFTLDGTVTGNLALVGGAAHLGNTAVVDGNLSNIGGSLDRAPGAVVRGTTNSGFTAPARPVIPSPMTPEFGVQTTAPRSWFARFLGWQFGTLGSILLMGLLGSVLVLLAPRGVGRVASATAVQPALSFVFGLLTLIVGFLAGAVLLLACGLGLLVWLVLLAAMVLGWIGIALWLGQRLLNGLKMRTASSIAEVLVGVVIITFLSRLPCIGWLFWLIFASWGLGGVVLTRFGTRDADAGAPPAPRPAIDGASANALPESSDMAPVATPAMPPVPPSELGSAASLTRVNGIDTHIAARLRESGIRTLNDLANSHPVELATASGVPVGQIMTEDWIGQAQRMR
jgi:predicted flap endonuclease-1-like 5' DNA nuclease